MASEAAMFTRERYQQFEVDDIPEGWESGPIAGWLVGPSRNGYSPLEKENPTGLVMLGLGCLTPVGFRPLQLKNAPDDDPNCSRVILQDGDLLVSRANTMALVGLAGVYRDVGAPCIYPDLMIRLCPAQTTSTEFLQYLLLSGRVRRKIRGFAAGTAGSMVKINSSIWGQLLVTMPPLAEQGAIVEVLQSVDDSIRATQGVIDQQRVVKQGLLQQLPTRGIGHTRFKQTEIGEIPESWEVRAVGDLTSLIKSGLSRRLSHTDIGVPVLISGNMRGGQLRTETLKYWHLDDPQGAATEDYFLEAGDILLNFINSLGQIGKSCVFTGAERPMIYSTNIFRIKMAGHMNYAFMHSLMATERFRREILRITKPAVNQASFTKAELEAIKLCVPPLPEQQAIVEILQSIDDSISAEQGRLAHLEVLKCGLMQDLLTGRVRVKVAQ